MRDEASIIVKMLKHDWYQGRLLSVAYNFFDKKSSATNKGTQMNSESQQLAKELHKWIIKIYWKIKSLLIF